MIVIVDYDIGNVAAVANMINRLGVRSVISSDPEYIRTAERIILPGNGSFDACMKNLTASGLIPIIEQRVLTEKVPLLGICVGAQMLGNCSEEGREKGLGWIDMEVKKFERKAGYRVPHMGWNNVSAVKKSHYMARNIDADSRFYFVHSYYMVPKDAGDIVLSANYGLDFSAGVARGNIAGVQFHPEKSHRFGKELFRSFLGSK